jgi:hypothetical protein
MMNEVQKPSIYVVHHHQTPLESGSTEGVYFTVTGVYYFVLLKLGVALHVGIGDIDVRVEMSFK